MSSEGPDIQKTIKLSNRNQDKLNYLIQEKHFKGDGEAIRYCLDLIVQLSKRQLLTEATAKLIEDME